MCARNKYICYVLVVSIIIIGDSYNDGDADDAPLRSILIYVFYCAVQFFSRKFIIPTPEKREMKIEKKTTKKTNISERTGIFLVHESFAVFFFFFPILRLFGIWFTFFILLSSSALRSYCISKLNSCLDDEHRMRWDNETNWKLKIAEQILAFFLSLGFSIIFLFFAVGVGFGILFLFLFFFSLAGSKRHGNKCVTYCVWICFGRFCAYVPPQPKSIDPKNDANTQMHQNVNLFVRSLNAFEMISMCGFSKWYRCAVFVNRTTPKTINFQTSDVSVNCFIRRFSNVANGFRCRWKVSEQELSEREVDEKPHTNMPNVKWLSYAFVPRRAYIHFEFQAISGDVHGSCVRVQTTQFIFIYICISTSRNVYDSLVAPLGCVCAFGILCPFKIRCVKTIKLCLFDVFICVLAVVWMEHVFSTIWSSSIKIIALFLAPRRWRQKGCTTFRFSVI